MSDEQRWSGDDEHTGGADAGPLEEWRGQSLEQMAERFRRAGVSDDAYVWARSEIDENFAQHSRFVFLKLMWRLMLEAHNSCAQAVGDVPGGTALLADHADDLARALAGPIGLFAHQVLYLLGGDVLAFGHEPSDDEPLWQLMESIDNQLTGRPVSALYEDLWHTHPEGEGAAEAGGWL